MTPRRKPMQKNPKRPWWKRALTWAGRKIRPWKYKRIISSGEFAEKMGYARSAEEYRKRFGEVPRRYLPKNAEIQAYLEGEGRIKIKRIRRKKKRER